MDDVIELLGSVTSFLSNNVGLIGALTSVVAVIAALWSAGAAARSARHAQDVDRRSSQRDVIGAAQSTIAEARRVDDLAAKLTLAYQTLFTFSGGSASSRLKMYVDEIGKSKQETAVLIEEVEDLTIDPKKLRKLSDEDLTSMLVRLNGHPQPSEGHKRKNRA